MRVLSIAGDENILSEGSFANHRMCAYAEHMDGLHIVVVTCAGGARASWGRLTVYPAPGRNAIARRLRAVRVGWAVCRDVQPDVISTQNAEDFGVIGWLLSRAFRVPLQVQVHTDVLSPHYRRASWKEALRYEMARFIIPRAACVRVVSKRIADSIRRELQVPEDRITLLPILTDTRPYLASEKQPETEARFERYAFRMVSAGRLVDREKRFSLLLDVMRELAPRLPGSVLVIAGEGPDRGMLEARVGSLGLRGSVILEPWRDDLPQFLKSFDLFVLASAYEGWGRAVIEAMAAGLPVVMTDVGLAGEVVVNGFNGVVVPVHDRGAMAAAILDLAQNAGKRRALARAARATAEQMAGSSMEDYYRSYAASLVGCLKP